jgi:hypothetical protein
MIVNWVLNTGIELDPTVEIRQLKDIGSLWGSWKTWRACQTDNVICHDLKRAQELIQRNFQNKCNFYIPNSDFVTLNRPQAVKIYEGEFVHDVGQQEDIVSMHLAASQADIVLLLGFDFTEPKKNEDRLQEHRAYNYRSLCKQAIKANVQTQWVLIDHPGEVMKDWNILDNLTCDSLSNVLNLLK